MTQNTAQKKTDKKLALLKARLQMPLIARDFLAMNIAPDAGAHYALHEMMSNFQPHDALLCAAFIMKEIAAFEKNIIDSSGFLHMECDRIIERYSAEDDFGQVNTDLKTFAEDMESFADLLDLCHMSYEIMNPKTAVLLNIIATQIEAQMNIVDTVLGMLETETGKQKKTPPYVTGYMADNVVMFRSPASL